MSVAETDVSSRLATFASGLQWSDVPVDVAGRVKLLFLDAIASAMTGWTSPQSGQVRQATADILGVGTTTVLGDHPTSMGAAVMVNGYLITARSLCDVHQPTLCHVTPVVVPPVLAIAEREDLDGESLLAALAAGIESTVRIGLGLDYPRLRARGWHTPGVAGPIGASLGVARALGFDASASERTMGLAASQAGGTFASFGTPAIKFHQARAAWSALLAAVLEEAGFVGPRSVLQAEDGGVFRVFSDGGSPEKVLEGLARDWRLMDITVRLWPAAAALQSILAILAEEGAPAVDEIEAMQISLPPANYVMNAEMGWATTFEATLSARYVTATALAHRDFWLEHLGGPHLGDEGVGEFAANRITVVSDPSLPEGGVRLSLELRSGEQIDLTRDQPKGSPDNPASWADIEGKLMRAAEPRVGRTRATTIVECVETLESLDSVRELTALLAG